MRALWSLPKAAPALLRHIAAYLELIALDVGRAQREIGKSLVVGALAAVLVILALFFACVALIAFYWDTPYRVTSILCICGLFAVSGVALFIYRTSLNRARSIFLDDARKQWEEDRVLLERILSPEEEERS